MTGRADVDRAREAASQGDVATAFDLLTKADGEEPLGPEELAFLGEIAYVAGRLDATIDAWERAHAALLAAGQQIPAAGAAVRVAMHLLFDTAMNAPVRGWLSRAERLLEGTEGTPPHAWFAVVRAYERLLSGDTEAAGRWAQRAIDIGSICDAAAAAVGRVAAARTRIIKGDVDAGLAELDEAGVVTMSGELDPMSTGIVYCELVCALQGLAQYDAAEQWTDAMERWSQTNHIGSLHGRCRVHRAEILRLKGSLHDAESELLSAVEELRPYLRREMGWPLTELARIRLRAGDIAGAEHALISAREDGWDPEPVLALLRLTQGRGDESVASIRGALERPVSVPSKEQPPNTDLRRAPLLEAQVEIELAAGDRARARGAADELTVIAERYRSNGLLAAASVAGGRVLLFEGRLEEARRAFAEGIRIWSEVGAPHEVAMARLELAKTLRVMGQDDAARTEDENARSMLERLRTGAALTVDRREAAGNMFSREGDYWSVGFEGKVVRVRDILGMRHLARLLAEPSREFHVLDLAAAEKGAELESLRSGDAGELLDERAKEAYRRRLHEIDEDIEEAHEIGDAERAAQAEREREFLARELSRAVGLGGRDRRATVVEQGDRLDQHVVALPVVDAADGNDRAVAGHKIQRSEAQPVVHDDHAIAERGRARLVGDRL